MPTPGAERDRQASMDHDRNKDKGGGRDNGMRDIAGANTKAGGYAAGGSVGGKVGGSDTRSFGRQISDLFGGPAAYARNKYRPGGGSVTVPNVPNASLGQIAQAVASGLGPANIFSGLNLAKDIYGSFQPGYRPGTGIMQGAVDSLFGGTPGGIQGTAQVGRMNDQGDPGQLRGALGTQPVQQAPGSLGTGAPAPVAPPTGVLSMEYPGGNVPIGGPSPYSYFRPSYNYFNR